MWARNAVSITRAFSIPVSKDDSGLTPANGEKPTSTCLVLWSVWWPKTVPARCGTRACALGSRIKPGCGQKNTVPWSEIDDAFKQARFASGHHSQTPHYLPSTTVHSPLLCDYDTSCHRGAPISARPTIGSFNSFPRSRLFPRVARFSRPLCRRTGGPEKLPERQLLRLATSKPVRERRPYHPMG